MEASGLPGAGADMPVEMQIPMLLNDVKNVGKPPHARLAAHNLTRGRLARFFWFGMAATALSAVAPVATPVAMGAAALALLGLLAHEHAYVQAGQSVPLA